MKHRKDRRLSPELQPQELRGTGVAVGALLLVTLIYAATIIG